MPDFSKPSVTVIGLGAMGSALAAAVLAAGYPTTVWNRSPQRAEPLVARGAAAAATPGEAIEASRLVIVCLLDMASVTDVLDPAKDVLAGRVLVNLTNGTPAQARDLAGRYDSDYLDGGIMAVPPTIGTPDAFVFYSGSRSAFDTNRTVLYLFGESRYVGDDAGLAALRDIALLSGCTACSSAACMRWRWSTRRAFRLKHLRRCSSATSMRCSASSTVRPNRSTSATTRSRWSPTSACSRPPTSISLKQRAIRASVPNSSRRWNP